MATSTDDARLAVAVLIQDTAKSPSQRKHALSWAPVSPVVVTASVVTAAELFSQRRHQKSAHHGVDNRRGAVVVLRPGRFARRPRIASRRWHYRSFLIPHRPWLVPLQGGCSAAGKTPSSGPLNAVVDNQIPSLAWRSASRSSRAPSPSAGSPAARSTRRCRWAPLLSGCWRGRPWGLHSRGGHRCHRPQASHSMLNPDDK